MYKSIKMKFNRNIFYITVLIALTSLLFPYPSLKAQAAASISVTEINYIDSTITLKVNDGDTEVFFSDSKKTTWETVPSEISSSNTITMDISWITLSKNYVLTFKANKSSEVISVTLPKQISNFKASYNKVKGIISFGNAGTRTIEWRKKESSTWSLVNPVTISTELSYLNTNGATVFFRLAPVNGTGITDVGYRASKEVSVTIPKKTAAPNIVINGSVFSIAVKKGMSYRTVDSDGTTSDWITISSSSDLLLKNIAAKALYTNSTTTQSEVTLQFRTNATSTSQVSNIATVTVPVQEGPPDEDTYGINFNYTSSSTVSLQVKAASSSVPFEYTVVKANETLNYQAATWKTIASGTAVSLTNTAAPTGSHIYVRKQSVSATSDTDFKLASIEIDVTGTNGIRYPSAPTLSTLTTLISTSGVCQTSNSSSYLTFQMYCPTSTTVAAIHFLNAYGIDKGTVSCKSTVAKNSGSKGDNDKYIITTKITSTANLDMVTQEILYAKITLANSDVITSSDTAGILLYLYPCTTLNNPSQDEDGYQDYTDLFDRIYMSNDPNDESTFKFRLDLGTAMVPSATVVNSYTSQAVAISTIKYDGYTLVNGTDYSVVYGSYVNDDEETIATATVTMNVASFEKSPMIDITDVEEPLHITLNNGEMLNSDIDITLIKTASLKDIPISWTITEGSLKETKTSVITNSDNTTTTVTEELISYTLTLSLFDKNYGVAVADVTWGGTSILGATTISNGTATIYLSNAKLNKLTTSSTATNNIVITLSNGYTITSGCKLTVLNATN